MDFQISHLPPDHNLHDIGCEIFTDPSNIIWNSVPDAGFHHGTVHVAERLINIWLRKNLVRSLSKAVVRSSDDVGFNFPNIRNRNVTIPNLPVVYPDTTHATVVCLKNGHPTTV
jgi:hypothetical protein